MDAQPEDLFLLRVKYLDWCSARIAEHLLTLSAEDIYLLAERTSGLPEHARGHTPAPVDARSAGDSLFLPGFEPLAEPALVRHLTTAVAAELDLPAFAAWVELYRTDPAPIERELLGFLPE